MIWNLNRAGVFPSSISLSMRPTGCTGRTGVRCLIFSGQPGVGGREFWISGPGMGGPPSVGAFPSGVTLSELTTYSLPVHEIMFKAAPSKSQATSQTIGREELPMTAAPSV